MTQDDQGLTYPQRARLAHELWHRILRDHGRFFRLRLDPDTTSRGSMAKALVLGVRDQHDFRTLSDYINMLCQVRHRDGTPMSTSTTAMDFTWWQSDPKARDIFNGRSVGRRSDGLIGVDLGLNTGLLVEQVMAELKDRVD